MNDFGERIKTLRKFLQWDQTRFAKRLGVAQSRVALWESGTYEPSLHNLCKIMRTFKVRSSFFFEDPIEQEAEKKIEK